MRRVGFGLVGYGVRGSHHARAIRDCPRARLVAIADSDEEARRHARETHPDSEVVPDYRQLLAIPEAEVVDVALPNDLHHEAGRAVVASGRRLLPEKPTALTLVGGLDLLEGARASSLRLGVTQKFHFAPMWGKIKDLIDAGSP